jgi:hypothetical protein
MLLVPGIMVALHFESELGECYKVTSQLYFECMMPFWEQACCIPVAHFVKTVDYLESIEDLHLEEIK